MRIARFPNAHFLSLPLCRLALAVTISVGLAGAPTLARAEVKSQTYSAQYCRAEGESPAEATRTAFEIGRRMVLEEISGALLWTDVVKEMGVSKTDLPAYAFFVTETTQKADRSNPAEKGCVALDIEGKIDTAAIEKLVRAAKSEPQVLWTIQSLWQRLDSLSTQLSEVVEKIRDTKDAPEREKLIEKKKALVDGMVATGYLRDSYAKDAPDESLPGMALSLDPTYADAYTRRAWAYVAMGKYDKALEDADKALALAPSSPTALVNRAVALRNLGQPEKAIEALTKAIQVKGDYTLAYHDRGVAEQAAGRYEEARKDFDKAIELDPARASSHLGRCGALLALGRAAEAQPACQKAVELAPASYEAHMNLGIALKLQGNVPDALKEYRRAIDIRNSNPGGYYNRALALLAQGKKDAARADWKKACDLGEKTACQSIEAVK